MYYAPYEIADLLDHWVNCLENFLNTIPGMAFYNRISSWWNHYFPTLRVANPHELAALLKQLSDMLRIGTSASEVARNGEGFWGWASAWAREIKRAADLFTILGGLGVGLEGKLASAGVGAEAGGAEAVTGEATAGEGAAGASGDTNGTLTDAELESLKQIANKYGTDIDVVGSRGAGNGRNIDTNLPTGKGPGTRSDIDVRIDPDVEINTGGRISDDLKNIGGGDVVQVLTKKVPTRAPYIQISPGGKVVYHR